MAESRSETDSGHSNSQIVVSSLTEVFLEKENHYLNQISSLESQIAKLSSQLDMVSSSMRGGDGNNQQQSVNRDYHVAELEAQVIQLQQQQPNWERQITELID